MSAKTLLLLLIPLFSSRAALLVGLDLTVRPFDQEKVVNAAMSWVDQNAEDSETVQVVAITARTQTDPIVLGEVTLPDRQGIRGIDRSARINQLKNDVDGSLKHKTTYPASLLRQSRVADLFLYATSTFSVGSSKGKIRRIGIWGDMLEVDDQANFETGQIDPQSLKIPHMTASVEIRAVRSDKYRSSDMWTEVRAAWTKALSDAGLKIRSYSSSY